MEGQKVGEKPKQYKIPFFFLCQLFETLRSWEFLPEALISMTSRVLICLVGFGFRLYIAQLLLFVFYFRILELNINLILLFSLK